MSRPGAAVGPCFTRERLSFSTGAGGIQRDAATRYPFLVGQPSSPLRRRVHRFRPPRSDLRACPKPKVPPGATSITQPLRATRSVHSERCRTHGSVSVSSSTELARRFRTTHATRLRFDECHVDQSGQWLLLHESARRRAPQSERRTAQLRSRQSTTHGGLGHLARVRLRCWSGHLQSATEATIL